MGNNKYKVLIVEDDRNILSFIQTVLDTNGYQALTAQSYSQALLVFASYTPDLVVLDLGLPDADGCTFIEKVRQYSLVPIIVLSARTEEQDKVLALDLGANDYITKPFSISELLARVRAALRSNRQGGQKNQPERFEMDGLVIDYDRRRVNVEGSFVHLTHTEYNILELLSRNCGKVLTYTAIIQAIWGTMTPGSVKRLQVNMTNIRKKLGSSLGESRYIANELGVGYRMLDDA